MNVGIIIITFLVLFAIVLVVVSIGLRFVEAQRKKKVGEILHTVATEAPARQSSILQDELDRTELFSAVAELPVLKRLQTRIQQAGLDWSAAGVVSTISATEVNSISRALVPRLVSETRRTSASC